MNTETEFVYAPDDASPVVPTVIAVPRATAPSENFVRAVSDFLDTDPADLLQELGFYQRGEPETVAEPVIIAAK